MLLYCIIVLGGSVMFKSDVQYHFTVLVSIMLEPLLIVLCHSIMLGCYVNVIYIV